MICSGTLADPTDLDNIREEINTKTQGHLYPLRNELKIYFPRMSELDLNLRRNLFKVNDTSFEDRIQEA